MNSFIISSLKKRTNHAITFYKNPLDYNQGLFWKIKKGQKSSVKGHNCGFLPIIIPKGHLDTPLKLHVCLRVLVENKAFYFLKKALRAGTARNESLK